MGIRFTVNNQSGVWGSGSMAPGALLLIMNDLPVTACCKLHLTHKNCFFYLRKRLSWE